MARVTVEDCLDKLGNQFELTTVASKRARQLARGAATHLDWDNDKSTVVALREIAEGYVDSSILMETDLPPMPITQITPEPPAEEIAEEIEEKEKKSNA